MDAVQGRRREGWEAEEDSGGSERWWLRTSLEARLAAAAGALFIGLSIWWILYDKRLPGGGDPGRHMLEAVDLAGRLRDLDLLAPLTYDSASGFAYPPLVRSIGSAVDLLGANLHDWGPIVLNLIFVPVLVAGCYLTGKLVFGRLAGLLAAIFALGSPMIMQLFHVYLIDAPLAAIVAFALWALLASDGFSRPRESAFAGALVGLAMLIKTPAPIFLAGPLAVILLRGGYRQRRGLALFAGAALVVAAPYYLANLDLYLQLSKEATIASEDPWTREFGWTFEGERRWELENYTWYVWAAINTQYLVPLLAFFAAGLVFCLSRLRRHRHLLELVAGLVVGYLGMTLLAVHDARYTLPLVVYVAVIATGWLTVISRRWLTALGVCGLLGVVAVNVAAGSFGALGTKKLTITGNDPNDLIHPGGFTFVDKRGYVVGEPRPDPFWEELLGTAREEGVDTAWLSTPETVFWGSDSGGFEVLARAYDIEGPIYSKEAEHRPDLVVTMWWTSDEFFEEQGYAPACTQIEEGIVTPPDILSPRDEGTQVSVLVERRRPDGRLERWCDFLS